MDRLLVTGGLGFIGVNFIKNTEADITVLDKKTYASNPEELVDCPVIEKDINQIDELDGDYDWIVHFAAESHVDNALNNPNPFWESNIKGTYEVTKFALMHSIKLLHVSTDEVFGDGGPFNEDSPYNPSNMYSISKAASDQIVRTQHRTYGLEYIITNCGNNYGPYQHEEKFIPQVLKGEVSLYADGKPIRDWIHVEDHVSALHAVMDGPINESYVISARDVMSTGEICRLAGTKVNYLKERPGIDMRYELDPKKIESLGWKPKHNIRDYIKENV